MCGQICAPPFASRTTSLCSARWSIRCNHDTRRGHRAQAPEAQSVQGRALIVGGIGDNRRPGLRHVESGWVVGRSMHRSRGPRGRPITRHRARRLSANIAPALSSYHTRLSPHRIRSRNPPTASFTMPRSPKPSHISLARKGKSSRAVSPYAVETSCTQRRGTRIVSP
jgi:hypothetical protein